MITVYGASDDLIELDGDIDEEFSHYPESPDPGVLLAFSEGTVLRIKFTDEGLWRITPEVRGKGELTITQCPADDDENYSDRATLTDARWVVYGSELAMKGRHG